MKKDWTIKKLGDCFISIANGANIKQIKGATGIPITRIETISNDVFNRDRVGYANITDYTKYEKYILQNDTILMSHINSMKFLGRSVLYERQNNEIIIHGMNLLNLIPNKDLIISKFACYYFSSDPFKKDINSISHQSVNQASFNTTALKALDIPLPPLEEQKRIVAVLDKNFAQIETLKTAAEKNLHNTKQLFQAELEKTFSNTSWEKKRLGDCGTLKNGMNFASTESGYSIPSLGVGDFKNLYKIENTETLSEISLNTAPSEEYLLKDGDIVFVRSNGNKELVGRCLLVYPKNIPTTYSGFCIRFRKDFNQLDADFLLHFMKSDKSRKILNGKEGANISNLNQKILGDFEVPLPPLEEQKRIVAHLDSLCQKVHQLEEIYTKQLADCDELKQAFLHKAFEGEL